jgi:hypothetical protein
LYPTGYVGAIVADARAAEGAEAALREACWAAEDVVHLADSALLDLHERQEQGQSPVERLAAFFASDERLAEERYVDEARLGRHVLFVRAPEPERAREVAKILEPYEPIALFHYGDNTMTELMNPSVPEETEP